MNQPPSNDRDEHVTDRQAALAVTTAALRRLLLLLLWFGSLSAVFGGIGLVVLNGIGIPLDYLSGTPFDSYVWPGLILAIVVGGTQGLAAVVVHLRYPYGAAASVVAGFGLMIWIFTELAILGEFSWLQVVYFGVGLGEVILVLVMLGLLDADRVRGRAFMTTFR